MTLRSMDESCILISDDEADASVRIVAEVQPKSPPIILEPSPTPPPPSPSLTASPPLIPTPTPSPPLILPSTPSPPLSPQLRRASSSQPLPRSNLRKIPPTPRSQSPPARPVKQARKAHQAINKEARKALKEAKQIDKQIDQLYKEVKRKNAIARQLENCVANIPRKIFSSLKDPDACHFDAIFDENSCKYQALDLDRNSITWTYTRFEVQDKQVVERRLDCDWTLVVMTGEDYLKRVVLHKTDPEDSNSLKVFIINQLENKTKGSNLIIMVFGLMEVIRKEKMKWDKYYKDAFKKGTGQPIEKPPNFLGPKELLELRLNLEIDLKFCHPTWKIHVEFQDKMEDAIKSIIGYTQMLAKQNRERTDISELGIDWAIDADKERAFDPTRSSEDLKKLWIRQLQQFSLVRVPGANAIANEYPSPQALLDQYRQLSCDEAENLLADIYVQKRYRKQIGPSISRKIHCFMTSRDPDVMIDNNESSTH